MDVQNGVVARLGEQAVPLLAALARATSAARRAGVTVVYVRVAFRAGLPEISPNNRAFSALSSSTPMGEDDAATEIAAFLAPAPGDIVVMKRRVSAFTGSDLEVVLRSLGVGHLVLTGIATSGVVLSTVREAADRDYEITVLEDACADLDAEVQRVLFEKVFPRQAAVMTVDAWVAQLDG